MVNSVHMMALLIFRKQLALLFNSSLKVVLDSSVNVKFDIFAL